MLFWTTFKVGLKSLLANPLRSFLAMLGIIIGVAAVISMLAIGVGAQKQVMDRLSAMGTNLLMVFPQQRSAGSGVSTGQQQNLTVEDALAIAAESPDVRRVAPVVGGNYQIKYMNHNMRARLQGVPPTYLPIRAYEIAKGRAITQAETEGMARVILLGPTVVENLFGPNEPVGEVVKLKGINFTVIGVLKAKGSQGWGGNPDEQVMIPYTVAMKQMLGVEYVTEIDVQANEGADLSKVQENITSLLRRRHHLQPTQDDDFRLFNQADIIEMANQTLNVFRTLLASIASVSLLVGGIGIMNIMLVTVTERTREIGVRKAIGAKERSILLQFLIESMIISGLGGAIGAGAGVGAAWLIETLTTQYATQPFPTVIQMSSIALAVSFSLVVGIFFGWYPALRAARLDPVDALRYE